MPTTLAVTGNYGQVLNFINGLDSFPRLFVIQNFNLTYGAPAASIGLSRRGASIGSAGATLTEPPLWTGGTATAPSAGPYSLAIDGSIYYTSTPSALDACTKATAAVH